jgi:hypothetical protein
MNTLLHLANDPVPDPEPAVPSLDQPDPEVFHRDSAEPLQPEAGKTPAEAHR